MRSSRFLLAMLLALVSGGAASSAELADAERRLLAADATWLDRSAARAAPLYEELLHGLPPDAEPFRSLVILRLARAQLAAGASEECLATLDLLGALEVVPEHHALAASELRELIATGRNPAQRTTPIPALPRASTTIIVTPGGPITSLAEAVAAARKAKAGEPGETVEIVLSRGTYLQTETVVLGEEDAGLVIRSQDRKRPATITGGVRLDRWTHVKDTDTLAQLPEHVRGTVLVCDLKAHGVADLGELVFGGFSSARAYGGNVRSKVFPVPELFHKGEPQVMARWPDDSLTMLPVDVEPERPDPRFVRWAKEKDLWLYGYWHWDWADAYEKLAGVSESGRITLEPPVNTYGFARRQGCAVNALCELDRPGEWHLDTKAGRIHFLPPKDFDPRQCVLSSYGTVLAARNCANLQVRDVKINFVRGDAMTFVDCPDLVLARIDIEDCSGGGLYVHGGARQLIHSCSIDSMGRGGIDIQSGNWQALVSSSSTIENCRISRLSRIDRTYTPGILLQGMGITVRRNAFVDIPSSAIRVETCDARIEQNVFRGCVYESGDQGVIDMWANPLYRGNVIRWNDFDRNVNRSGASYGAAAVRHDDFISGFMVSENIFRTGSGRGFGSVQFNGGTDNIVEGNLIIDWHVAVSGQSLGGDEWAQRITGHENSARVLRETDWKSDAWRAKYPMVRDLMRGDDNRNYIVDNVRAGEGSWGEVGRAVFFANRESRAARRGEGLRSVKPLLVPWHPIPIDAIGPYDTR